MGDPNVSSFLGFGETLLATLLGGLLSFLGARWSLNKSFEEQRDLEQKKRKQDAALRAFGAFHKLLNTHNEAANIKKHIDDAFQSADEAGDSSLPPWAKVRIIVGDSHRDVALSPLETSFLIDAKNADLVNRAHIIQRRVWNLQANVDKFNEVRASLQKHLESHAEDAEVLEGAMFGANLTGRAAVVAQMYEATLNSLLGQLMEMLELDVPESFAVAKEFQAAAAAHFGEDFPKFVFERESERKVD